MTADRIHSRIERAGWPRFATAPWNARDRNAAAEDRPRTLPRIRAPIKSKGHPLWSYLSDRLGSTEMQRRAWHMLPGFLPFVLWIFPRHHLATPASFTIFVSTIIVGLAAAMYVGFCRIQRQGEEHCDCLTAVCGYSGSILATLILFPSHPELAFTVLAVLAFGDGSATLGGMLLGGRRLPWNERKSYAGSACFLVVGTLMATLAYWGAPHYLPPTASAAALSIRLALLVGLTATVAGAIAESLPVRQNDNPRVGLAAALGVIGAQALLVGLPALIAY